MFNIFSFSNQIEPFYVMKCLDKQENKRSTDLRKYYIKNNFYKEKFLLKNPENVKSKWGNVYPIAKVIDYLPINERAKLLFVSKSWRLMLERKVIKSLLLKEPNNRNIEKKRIDLWLNILKYVNILKACNFNPIRKQ